MFTEISSWRRNFPLIHGLRFEADPFEWTQSELLRDGCTEPLTSRLYAKLLRPGDVYVDVGAHVGFHTLLARHFVREDGRLIAIEPQPYNCNKILANCRSNNFTNIFVYVAAAGDSEGAVALHAQSAADTARLSLALDGVSDQAQLFQVPIRRLDSIFQERRIDRVRLLKIDVEGFELSVVNGLGERLQDIDHMVVELLDAGPDMSKNTVTLIQKLSAAGFKLTTVTGETWNGSTALPESNLLATHGSK